MRRIICIILTAVMALSAFTVSLGEEALPTAWDLTEIYADEAAWQADYDRAMAMLPEYEKYRGKLDNAQSIYDYIMFSRFGELNEIQSRLQSYVELGLALNATNAKRQDLSAKLDAMDYTEGQYTSVIDAEIFAIPLEERQKIFSDPLFGSMEFMVKTAFADPDDTPLSAEQKGVLNTMSGAIWDNEDVFDILYYTELPAPEITMPDGTVRKLTDESYNEIANSTEYSREFRAQARDTFYGRTRPFQNTFAKLMEGSIRANLGEARLHGYDTVREYMMKKEHIEPEIYDMIVGAAHDGLPDHQRYYRTAAKARGVDKLYIIDLRIPATDFVPGNFTYGESVKETEAALSVLGEEYVKGYDEIIRAGHVDVYPAENKENGAFENCYGGKMPWVLLNHMNTLEDAATLVHEMGHAMYEYMASKNQPAWNLDMDNFTHEVASTTNELLFYSYKIRNAQSREEKLYYLENLLDMFGNAFFRQVMFSEFEEYMNNLVEADGALSGEDLNRKMDGLFREYQGDAVIFGENEGTYWAELDHFYYSYYVYKYATAVTYAASIVQRILGGEEGAVEAYLSFLKAGSSARPSELLAIAGVDPLKKETYEGALTYYRDLVDEYEKLVEN